VLVPSLSHITSTNEQRSQAPERSRESAESSRPSTWPSMPASWPSMPASCAPSMPRLHAPQKSPQSLIRMEDRMCRKRARPSASTSAASRPISWSLPPRAAPGDSATAAEEEAGDNDSGKLMTTGVLLGVRVGGWRERSGFPSCSPATRTVYQLFCAHAHLPGQGGGTESL